MPRRVDHEERRRQITDACRRVVARDGLEAATFQAVAAEAGVSVRLVQYYFGHKHGLLMATHRAVIEDAAGRFGGGEPAAPPPPRAVLRAVLAALLPLDDARRADAVVLAAFHAAALTNEAVEPEELRGAPRVLVDVVAAQVLRARGDDGAGGAGTVRLDAELVLAAAAGLTQGIVAGHLTGETALAVVDRLLDQLVGAAPGVSGTS
ncbi:TetR/AcrR family transcriptional regulator [Krasilnikoviella flava]|uniref:Transcriptional regulator, TetR family n=1 Tax=Krasilnikoviella flava TaxID=526729 RepID=A0A1T5IER3_9MICO|nr:TetR family transcriptional regulator [Krasilnikoviella flava]SKC37681.1 transcriptional regulator, TetR family [Krasilnikoviella flava]